MITDGTENDLKRRAGLMMPLLDAQARSGVCGRCTRWRRPAAVVPRGPEIFTRAAREPQPNRCSAEATPRLTGGSWL